MAQTRPSNFCSALYAGHSKEHGKVQTGRRIDAKESERFKRLSR